MESGTLLKNGGEFGMPTTCTRCEGTGFINLHQIPDVDIVAAEESSDFHQAILDWIAKNTDHDVSVCDCCGDGDEWYGVPGEHYNNEDPSGPNGPYAYNGGLCECH